MKKFLLGACIAALAMSAQAFNLAQANEANLTPVKMENVKKAPAALQAKMAEKWAARLKATPSFPYSGTSDLVGGYQWAYRQYTGGFTTQPDTISNNYTYQRDTEDNVDIVGINKVTDDSIRITGMFVNPVGAKMGTSGGYTTFTIGDTQTVYTHSSYGACNLRGVWYYEGDDTYAAGWYIGDVMGFILDDYQAIMFDTDVHFYMVIASGTYAGYRLGWIYEPGSVMMADTDYNAMMTYDYNNMTYDYPAKVSEDENFVVTVENFSSYEGPVTITLAEDHTWAADSSLLFTSTNGDFKLYGISSDLVQLTGTGTETVLTFDTDWTGYAWTTGYWTGQRGAATITRIDDGVFVYPTAEPTPVYILGEIGENDWAPNVGVEMTTEDGVTYTADVTLDGRNDENRDGGVNYFSFTTKLSDDANDWDGIAANRFGAVSDGDFWVSDQMVANESPISLTYNNGQSLRLAQGNYTFTVNLEDMTLTIKSNAITGIETIDTTDVAGVKYVNLSGQVSSTPFSGMNIMVTTLSDGSTRVAKVIK